MKKIAIAALTAIVATMSLASVAEAGWKWKHRHHHRWHGHHHSRIFIAPRVVYYGDTCMVRKVRYFDAWGNYRVKRVRYC